MNSKKRITLRISAMCFEMAVGALAILSLVGVVYPVRAQNAPAESVVYSFATATGAYPTGVVRDAVGNLYVGTEEGGSNQSCDDGCGNILKLSFPGGATELYAFTPTAHGSGPLPVGALTRDAKGNLYGATESGGNVFAGSVFKLTPSGLEGTLHSFDPAAGDGSTPSSGLTIDSAGNLYGVTYSGPGSGAYGVIYKVTPSRSETLLHSFTGGTDGAVPQANPVVDSLGNLYGTASAGGDLSCTEGSGAGCGTVWKLDTSGNFTVLYSFTGGTEGAAPIGGLVMDSSGNLYGTTIMGGDLSCFAPYGCGTVFELSISGNLAVLYSFTGGSSDGASPFATLLRDPSGNLYGTTEYGGDQSCAAGGSTNGCGVVFKVDASGNETILHAFTGGTTDGALPTFAALITDVKGNLYGATSYGGNANVGVIFAVRAQ
jgi:uncharacterized repeat protein (TIGR03803 family)